jgi:hypothetical protein
MTFSCGNMKELLQAFIYPGLVHIKTHMGSKLQGMILAVIMIVTSPIHCLEQPFYCEDLTSISLEVAIEGRLWVVIEWFIWCFCNANSANFWYRIWSSLCLYWRHIMWRHSNSPCECIDCRLEHLQEQLNTQQSEIEAL